MVAVTYCSTSLADGPGFCLIVDGSFFESTQMVEVCVSFIMPVANPLKAIECVVLCQNEQNTPQ